MNNKRVAIIGSRDPTESQATLAKDVATLALCNGWDIATGAAEGIDLIAISTAESMGMSHRLHIYLPWRSYNEPLVPGRATTYVYAPDKKDWIESVSKYHPMGGNLSQGVFKLMARNYGIVVDSDVVVALPSAKPGGGGTGQGIRIALALNIPLFKVEGQEQTLPDPLVRLLNK